MNTKFITFLLALICSLPMMAKVYTVMSPNKSLVVNISVDKTLKWEIKSGKTIVLLPSEIALQTDKQCLGKNMKVKKSSICNNKVGNRKYQQLTLGAGDYDCNLESLTMQQPIVLFQRKLLTRLSTRLRNLSSLTIILLLCHT